jgi:hypothetical protein
MARDSELDRLTAMLGECLGRIDEGAFRLQQLGDTDDPASIEELLEQETAALQESIEDLVGTIEEDHDVCDVRAVVDSVVSERVAEIPVPIVVRMQVPADLPLVRCAAVEMVGVLRRAIKLATRSVVPGDELALRARGEADAIVLELECSCTNNDLHMQQRSMTLCEFVAGVGGHCIVDVDDRGKVLIAMELPRAAVCDDS